MSTQAPDFVPPNVPLDARLAIIAARFNQPIVDELLNGCVRRLGELGMAAAQLTIERVPGAFELPIAAKAFAATRRYSAIICLGAVVRGETPHFEYVAGECARGLQDVAIEQTLPVIFGVLTTNTEEQARDRIGGKHGHAGERAAEAALEMITLLRRVRE